MGKSDQILGDVLCFVLRMTADSNSQRNREKKRIYEQKRSIKTNADRNIFSPTF